jgi:hypothetical protein
MEATMRVSVRKYLPPLRSVPIRRIFMRSSLSGTGAMVPMSMGCGRMVASATGVNVFVIPVTGSFNIGWKGVGVGLPERTTVGTGDKSGACEKDNATGVGSTV